jgi:membrane associated rhomboid family serine protease
MTLSQTFSDPRILFFLLFWVVLNAFFGLSSVSIGGAEGGIAWEAHIGGFLFGLFFFGYFDRQPVLADDAPDPRGP